MSPDDRPGAPPPTQPTRVPWWVPVLGVGLVILVASLWLFYLVFSG